MSSESTSSAVAVDLNELNRAVVSFIAKIAIECACGGTRWVPPTAVEPAQSSILVEWENDSVTLNSVL